MPRNPVRVREPPLSSAFQYKNMDILQITPRYPPQTGGVETHTQQLSEELTDRGHTVEVLTTDAETHTTTRDKQNGITVHRHYGIAPANAYHFAPTLPKTIRDAESRFDVIHAHNYHSLPLVTAAFAARDTPVVVTPHYHGASQSALRNILHSVYRPVGRRGLDRADAAIAVSDWERQQLQEDLDIHARVIPNGIRELDSGATTDGGREDGYVLSVGRLEEYKGVQYIIDAIGDVDMNLVVAGTGPYEEQLRARAREAGVSENVEFLGYVSDERLAGLYVEASVFVSMSSFESYGVAVGEALSMGTPAVVRGRGALRDWGGRDDCVVAEPGGLSTAIGEACGLTAPSSMVPRWESVVDEVVDVYEGVV